MNLSTRRRMISRLAFGVTVWMACAVIGRAAEIAWFGGTYSNWPTSWTAIPSLNDPDDGFTAKMDFVGNTTYPGAYWAEDASYIYFRMRVDLGTIATNTYSDTVHVLIDRVGYGNEGGMPDYGFSWDSNQNIANHGLEMTVLGTSGTTWGDVAMDDIDGNSGQKLARDINGNGRTGDGYVRTIDGQAMGGTGFDTDSSFIDFAVSWDYLTNVSKGNTNLAPGQTWRIALASSANATDHNTLRTDIAGGASTGTNPSTGSPSGWSGQFGPTGVPEPSSMVVLGVVVLSGYVGHRLRRKKHDASGSADPSPTGLVS